MKCWIKLAKRFAKIGLEGVLELLEVFSDKMFPNENIPAVNYPNGDIDIELGDKGLVIKLAEYEAVLNVDKMLGMNSIAQLQWWVQSQIQEPKLSQEDAATISALMIQRLIEKEYITDITPPV